MSPELEKLLAVSIAVLAVVTLVLLIRAVLGVNTTHAKLDEILRELQAIKSKDPKPSDPSPCGSDATSAREEGEV